MPSRSSLSILAAIFGAALMYFLQYYGLVNAPPKDESVVTNIIVVVCWLAVAWGWVRIFRRRPAKAPGEDAAGG